MAIPKNPRSKLKWLALACVVLLLVGAIGWLLYLGRGLAYQDTAIGGLRQIVSAEETFKDAHPNLGYTCTFSQLQFDRISDWSSPSDRQGVAFALSGCESKRPNLKYRATALPGRGDVQAFCADQSGVVRYDLSRSLEKCFQSGTPL